MCNAKMQLTQQLQIKLELINIILMGDTTLGKLKLENTYLENGQLENRH